MHRLLAPDRNRRQSGRRHPYAYAEWHAIDYRTSKVQKAA
jgi:hypothetical protein